MAVVRGAAARRPAGGVPSRSAGALLLLAGIVLGAVLTRYGPSLAGISLHRGLAAGGIDRWRDAPPVNLSAHVPPWWDPGCARRPCKFAELVDGPQDRTVAYESQFGEDQWLVENLLWNKRNGFYLEMGAMDGLTISNTIWLARAANWTGMLIEACPDMAPLLFERRPESICVHAAVCGSFSRVHWVSAGNVGGIVELMAEDYRKEYHPNLDVSTLPEVPCLPMQYLLDRYGVTDVDLWSLDVEGAELEVLKTVDFSRLRVKVLMIELDGRNPAKDAQVGGLLAAVGFDRVPKAVPAAGEQPSALNRFNTVFVHRSAWGALAHAPHIKEVVQQR